MLTDGQVTYGSLRRSANRRPTIQFAHGRIVGRRLVQHGSNCSITSACANAEICLRYLPNSAFKPLNRRSTHHLSPGKELGKFIGLNALMNPGRLALVIITREFSLRRA